MRGKQVTYTRYTTESYLKKSKWKIYLQTKKQEDCNMNKNVRIKIKQVNNNQKQS